MSKPRELTIKFLRSAERTVHELELHLAKAGFDASTIEIESEWAKSKGYVNDERVVKAQFAVTVSLLTVVYDSF